VVSVIIVISGRGGNLASTVSSLREQTLKNCELIVIDDGSGGEAWQELAVLHMPRLRAHRNLRPRGLPAALNQALAWASGEYVAYHEGGDISAAERLERQVALLERRPDVAAVTATVEWMDTDGALITRRECPAPHRMIMNRLQDGHSLVHGATMVRRAVLLEAGGHREALRLAAGYDLWLRLGEQHKLAALQTPLVRSGFDLRQPEIARGREQAAYMALARQLAAERREHGAEQQDAARAAQAIAARYERMGILARRAEQAASYLDWATQARGWGAAGAACAHRLWLEAMKTWPFDAKVWQFSRQGDTPPGRDEREADEGPDSRSA
jgi:glycosyltransferase involved in cell wall biosynthesis